MKDGFKQGKSILLEPIMKVENITPEEYQGDIIGDLNRRRAKINSIESRGNLTIVHAEVPLAEMFGYATAIRSLSKGRSSYSMEPFHFEPVPANLVSAILDQRRRSRWLTRNAFAFVLRRSIIACSISRRSTLSRPRSALARGSRDLFHCLP
jgi:translation elongation factor EF-G